MLKQKHAITLIALIITTIVLLILAGVVINITLGNDGIISKTQSSVDKYQNAQEKEAAMINTIGENMFSEKITAEMVAYTPDPSLKWTGITNVKQALDYLYTH